MATAAGYNRSVFQVLAQKIRYLADQWNFAVDQRIEAALSTEKQWKFGRALKTANLVTCQRSIPAVKPGEKVVVDFLPAGRAELRAAKSPASIDAFIGCLRRPESRSLSTEEIAEIAAQGWSGGR
jgi:hypothetical protein